MTAFPGIGFRWRVLAIRKVNATWAKRAASRDCVANTTLSWKRPSENEESDLPVYVKR